MQENQAEIAHTANVIARVALSLGLAHIGKSLHDVPCLGDFEVVCRWSGSTQSNAIVSDEFVGIDLALHELLAHRVGSKYYYSESTASARKSIPDDTYCMKGAISALVAHEVAHLLLFTTDTGYGARPHNRHWLELTLILRSKLLPIFGYDIDQLHGLYLNGYEPINTQWPLAGSYLRNYMSVASSDLDIRSFLVMLERLIGRLIKQSSITGLVALTASLLTSSSLTSEEGRHLTCSKPI
ncbi:hypothetical protein L1D14_03910 [Vibrio tubiashii]|uniref:hypothetical protein n=1 Tax=Vibrio tubiashii TaxID=29498 RepID=UPI001EFEE196|nr:hypothetical protein [Vibrio tubiashii]MCG9575376.1 hypothetical protein [Vibrio tubiashii]